MSNKKLYWKGPEELSKDPNYMKTVANEFAEDLPMEEFLGDQNTLANSSTSRRDFLKFTGFSLAAATLAACESPVVKTIPYVTKPEEVTPGVASWYASSYYDGQLFGSILVKSREGRPIFIKGNKQYGFAGGALHPRITASVLTLYDGARLKKPRIGKEEKTWAKVDDAIKKDLAAVYAEGGNVRILTPTITSPSTLDAINKFMAGIRGEKIDMMGAGSVPMANDTAAVVAPPAPVNALPAETPAEAAPVAEGVERIKHVQYDTVSYFAMREANRKSFGLPTDKMGVLPDYDFSKAKTIIGINCDFLGNWMLPNQNTTGYLKNRKADNDWMSKHYQFETVLSLTGSNADVRVPIKPSHDGWVAAALYQHVTGESLGAPQDILEKTKLAGEDLKSKLGSGESLVVAGANDENVQIIVNALNMKLGNYATTINMNDPVNMFMGNDREVKELFDNLSDKDAIFIYGNPVYSLPKELGVADKIKAAKLSVSFSGYADETASLCKYTAPDHHYLEAWNDHNPKRSMYAMQQPLIRPLYKTAAWQESLLVWVNAIERKKDSTAFTDHMKNMWRLNGFPRQTTHAIFEDYWNYGLHNGVTAGPAAVATSPATWNADAKAAAGALAASGSDWEVLFYQKIGIGDGQQANNPWLQELPDPISRVTWDNYVTMNPSDMEKKGYNLLIAQEYPASVVKVTIDKNTLTLPVYPSPGQAINTIGIALGYGRGANDENIGKAAFQTGEYGDYLMDGKKKVAIGKNAFHVTSISEKGFLTYAAAKISIADTGETYPIATTQTSHTLMDRDSVLRETTWNLYKTGTKEDYNEAHKVSYYGKEKPVKEIDLWEQHPIEHIGHRWVMTIDLNSCIGCGNCIISCHTENNVPVVGKDEVRRSRDMHWLRIDRYYSSDMNKEIAAEKGVGTISAYAQMEKPSENPQVLFQPMLCQHCNHAPCETVCPVLATTHSKEGLNQMTYNRCIGTRYCANNCPYKVRRFNWFNYQDYKKFKNVNPSADETFRWVLNPDVTVRSRGVMEKCSFCVQRIQDGKLTAKKESRKLVDGNVTTACAEACPTDAIKFGDWNDTESVVRKESQTPRAYMALEEVGIQPNIYYMVKVRNVPDKPQKKKHHGGHGHEEEHTNEEKKEHHG